METKRINGEDVTRYVERSDQDGGLVLVHVVPDGNGGYFAHREWMGKGVSNGVPPSEAERKAAQAEARRRFDAMTDAMIAERAAAARAPTVRRS